MYCCFRRLYRFSWILWFVNVAERSLADIRRDTYFKLITLPMNFFSNRRVGELNSRISADLSQIQDTLTTTIAEMIRQSVLLVGGVVFMAMISIKLAIAMLILVPPLIIVALFFGRFHPENFPARRRTSWPNQTQLSRKRCKELPTLKHLLTRPSRRRVTWQKHQGGC